MNAKESLVSRKALAVEQGVRVETIDCWIRVGVAGAKLRPHYLGGRVFIDRDEVARFHAAVTKSRSGYTPPAPTRKTPPEVLERLRRRGYKVGGKK